MMRVKMKQMIWKKVIMRIQIRNVGACILRAREVAWESNKKKRGPSEGQVLGKAIWSKYATKYGKTT